MNEISPALSLQWICSHARISRRDAERRAALVTPRHSGVRVIIKHVAAQYGLLNSVLNLYYHIPQT